MGNNSLPLPAPLLHTGDQQPHELIHNELILDVAGALHAVVEKDVRLPLVVVGIRHRQHPHRNATRRIVFVDAKNGL